MTKRSHVLFPVAFSLVAGACAPADENQTDDATQQEAGAPDPTPTVVLETNHGRIVMELDRANAPVTVTNFLRHVGAGFYDGLTFHRVRPGFMIQGGRITPERERRTSQAAPLQNEADNGLKNLRGTVAMARTREPHSAVSEFFINLVDNAELDYTGASLTGWGYAVFGQLTEGLDVIDAIAAVQTERWGQHEALPLTPVVIERAYIQDSGAN